MPASATKSDVRFRPIADIRVQAHILAMARKRERAPQEKTALSYAKDCRNGYGQNDKASRKLIPLHEAQDHRLQRRVAVQSVNNSPRLAAEASDTAESTVEQNVRRLNGWMKGSDVRLGEVVKSATADRAARANRPRNRLVLSTPTFWEPTLRIDAIMADTKLSPRQRSQALRPIYRE